MLYTVLVFVLLFVSILLIGLLSHSISKNIKKANYISSTQYGELVQLLQDKHELHRFGFGQYLKRGYSDFNAFHMSFMNMGVIVCLIFMANYIFQTVSISLALLIFSSLAIFYILTATANARLLANQPTAGGLYHVIYKQVGSLWASFAGVIKLIAQLTTTILYSFFSMMMLSMLVYPLIPSIQNPLIMCLGMALIIGTQAVVANFKSALTRWMQGMGIILFWIMLISLSIGFLIFLLPNSYSPFYFLIGESPFVTSTSLSTPISIAMVIIILAKCFVGHDEAAANAEETIEPKIKIPWAAFMSSSYTVVLGFVFLLSIGMIYFNISGAAYVQYHTTDWLTGLLQLPLVIQYSIIIFLIAISWYNGLFSVVNGSRHVMAMARDLLLPFSQKISSITLIRQTPHYAILFYLIVSAVGCFSYTLFNQVELFLLQLIALTVAGYSLIYVVALFFSYFKGEQAAVWTLKRGDIAIKLIAIVFNCVILTLAVYFLSWQLIILVFCVSILNVIYTYIKHGYIKLAIQATINKNEFERERRFPLQ